MTEVVDVKKEIDKYTWFSHLVLESDAELIRALSGDGKFVSTEATIDLKINGHTLRVEDFNKVLANWGERIESAIKEELNYMATEQAFVKKAEELVESKLEIFRDAIQDIENNLWKLSQ